MKKHFILIAAGLAITGVFADPDVQTSRIGSLGVNNTVVTNVDLTTIKTDIENTKTKIEDITTSGMSTLSNDIVAVSNFVNTTKENLETTLSTKLTADEVNTLINTFAESLFTPDKDLGSITVTGTWTWVKNDGTTPAGSSNNKSISIENGFKASWAGAWYWTTNSSQKAATSCSGDFGTNLPESNTPSETFSKPIVTSNKSYIQRIHAPKNGLTVSGNKVFYASGLYTNSASVSVSFLNRYYYGVSASSTPDASTIKGFSTTSLTSTKVLTVNNVQVTSGYFVYAYPKSLGLLSKITQDGAQPIFTAFTKLTDIDIVNDAGITVSYYVYRSNNPGAFAVPVSLKFE